MGKISITFLTAVIIILTFSVKITGQILYDAEHLKKVKESITAGKNEFTPALKKLKADAEKALEVKPLSVVNKKQVPPSGDKRDYMSPAKYWWPDPSKPDGKPYIRKDGEVYPGTADYPNHDDFAKLVRTVETLALAYYFTNNEDYAAHASKLLKVWFIDAETKMNPNMNYAQSVAGKNEGRGSGIIDVHGLPVIIDAVTLLNGSNNWGDKEQTEIKKWFEDYLTWLVDSKNGKDESKAKNNHGTWYDVQVTSVALFTGKNDIAKKIVNESLKKRIALQVEPDGKQPLELVRTTSLHYSMFNLEALFQLAKLAEQTSIDLWNYKTEDGRGIKTALDFLVPYLGNEKKWEYKQIKEFDINKHYSLLVRAYLVYKDKKYIPLINACKVSDYKKQRSYLIYETAELD